MHHGFHKHMFLEQQISIFNAYDFWRIMWHWRLE